MTKILAIETSCDETSVAVVEDGRNVLSNIVASQVKIHAKYGGVVPEYASRMHAEKINLLIDEAVAKAGISLKKLDAVAVTYGPGLEGALLVGVTAAKTLAMLLNIPLIPINHLHGHIYANFIAGNEPELPFVTLIVSGGHTQLVVVKDHMQFELIGTTRDDAAGEAFDKIARFLDLGYPGGPIVEKLAQNGNDKAFNFPRPMLGQGFEFSFSGLKTAVIQALLKMKNDKIEINKPDVCASFQKAVIDVLLKKSLKACKKYQISRLVLSGGVTANKTLRNGFEKEAQKEGITCFVPPFAYCTDNAAMIGATAFFAYQLNPGPGHNFRVQPSLKL
ncbi:tRNA (adenosine(37)-N6)-threonylcarbamoyltransferase complex transferase subunit TsaD [Candidatus Margulisiibacteriota bacterium]